MYRQVEMPGERGYGNCACGVPHLGSARPCQEVLEGRPGFPRSQFRQNARVNNGPDRLS